MTMDDIAKENGISKRTLYEHFSDKSDLLEQSINYFYKQMMEEAVKIEESSNDILDLLFKLHDTQSDVVINLKINFFKELKRYHFPIYKNAYKKFSEYHQKKIMEYLTRGQKEGFLLENLDKDLICGIIIEISNMIEGSEIFTKYRHSRRELFRSVIILYFRGISTPKGIEIIDRFLEKTKR